MIRNYLDGKNMDKQLLRMILMFEVIRVGNRR